MYKEIKESWFIGGREKLKEENNIYFKQCFYTNQRWLKGVIVRKNAFEFYFNKVKMNNTNYTTNELTFVESMLYKGERESLGQE